MSGRPHPSSPEEVARQYETDDTPSRSSMRGDMQIARNPSTDQKNQRRRQRQKTSAEESRMTTPTQADVTTLRRAAARAATLQEQQYLMGEAERADAMIREAQAAERDTDLGARLAADHLVPGRVHELNTEATDWLSTVASAGDDADPGSEMQVQADLWYERCHTAAKADDNEFEQQARGMARHQAGRFGGQAASAEHAFLSRVAGLRARDVEAGRIVRTSALSQSETNAGPPVDGGVPGSATSSERAENLQTLMNNNPSQDVTPTNDPGLGQTNDIASGKNGDGNPQQDVGVGQRSSAKKDDKDSDSDSDSDDKTSKGDMPPWMNKSDGDSDSDSDSDSDDPDPDNNNDNPFGKKDKKESSMQSATCPACSGRGKVATRVQGVSGLPQIDQTIDNHDNGPEQTAYPEAVAFPWVMDPNNVNKAISETESQLAQRDKLKGAARQAAIVQLAGLKAMQQAHRQRAQAARQSSPWSFIAGQDYSGWAGGDMGAKGNTPGEQDGGNPGGPNNIEVPDPVYGFGGDTQNPGPNKPFGADEANDRTNQPSGWNIGGPTQMDQGTVNPAGSTGPDGSPPFPNPPKNQSQGSRQAFLDNDPQLAQARAFAQRRVALWEAGQLPEYQGR